MYMWFLMISLTLGKIIKIYTESTLAYNKKLDTGLYSFHLWKKQNIQLQQFMKVFIKRRVSNNRQLLPKKLNPR